MEKQIIYADEKKREEFMKQTDQVLAMLNNNSKKNSIVKSEAKTKKVTHKTTAGRKFIREIMKIVCCANSAISSVALSGMIIQYLDATKELSDGQFFGYFGGLMIIFFLLFLSAQAYFYEEWDEKRSYRKSKNHKR